MTYIEEFTPKQCKIFNIRLKMMTNERRVVEDIEKGESCWKKLADRCFIERGHHLGNNILFKNLCNCLCNDTNTQ